MIKKKKLLFGGIVLLATICVAVILIVGKYNMRNPFEEELSKSDQEISKQTIEAYIASSSSESNYYTVLKQWMEEDLELPKETYTNVPAERVGGEQLEKSESKDYPTEVTHVEPQDEFIFSIETKQEGLYEIWLDYYILDNTISTPEISIEINNENQYNETNLIQLSTEWEPENLIGEARLDRYGDELPPRSLLKSHWETKALFDPNHFSATPLKFKLAKGNNEIKLTVNEGSLLFGDIVFTNRIEKVPTYDEYKDSYRDSAVIQNQITLIEAENMSSKSRQSIRPKYLRDSLVTPYEYKTRVLNILDGDSFADAGDTVSYDFSVNESGFYALSLKYFQNTNNGMPTRRRIEIDGEVPFEELSLYSFEYAANWRNLTLENEEGEPYYIYLTEGDHTLTLSINNSDVATIYHELLGSLQGIELLANEITQLTGGVEDKNRNWRIERYMPDIKTYLSGLILRLKEQKNALSELLGNDRLPVITEIEIAINMLEDFYKKPNDIPNYMKRFSEGDSSAYGRIQSVLPSLVTNPLNLDKFFVHSSDIELPKAKANILSTIWEGTKAFTYSFFNPRYSEADEVDADTIEVWVNQSRLNMEIMQRLIDEQFTPETNIKVNLSLLPDEQRIVLSNAASSVPDAALSVSHNMPFELGLRGIIEDLRGYDGFYDLTKEFNPNSFTQLIYDEGVYGIPETQTVKLLYYRKDLLNRIGEEPPQTWEEVVSLIPMLQRYDMNAYIPLGANNAFKGLDNTTPFIYQFGGRLYNDTGNKAEIHLDGAYEAFDFMTSLFTVYNMPVTTSEFFQSFRDGKIPIGIADANLYIQLKHAAPELAGQWGILPIPGVENDDGVIERWDPTYGNNSIIFSESDKKDKSWEFIKWWTSSTTQATFSYDIQSTLGSQFLYATANIEAFEKSSWPSDSKQVILDQWEWMRTTGRVPGDYALERELSNAWNKVVVDGENPRIAIDQSIRIIDKELERKLREFGYIEGTELVKPYKVPVLENVESWVRKENE